MFFVMNVLKLFISDLFGTSLKCLSEIITVYVQNLNIYCLSLKNIILYIFVVYR